jgi:hypothetical protein
LLRQRAANEVREINPVASQHAQRYAVVPLLIEEPVGTVQVGTPAEEIAKLLLVHRINGLPAVERGK